MRKDVKNSGGFTFVEVMVAVLVFGASIIGIIAFQKAAIVGSAMARDRTVATNMARYMLAQLQNEALSYTDYEQMTKPDDYSIPLCRSAANATRCNWMNYSWNADPPMRIHDMLHTNEENANYSDARFCMHYRLVNVGPETQTGGTGIIPGDVIRADVRVTWWKQGQIPGTQWTNCQTLFDEAFEAYDPEMVSDSLYKNMNKLFLSRLMFIKAGKAP